MMHHSVTKMWGKYLSLHRITDNECCTRLEFIGFILYLIPELDTLRFIVELELECTERIPFVRSTIIVRCEDVGERKHNPKNILIIVSHDTKWNYTSSRFESIIVNIRSIRMELSCQHIAIPILRPRSQIGKLSILYTTIIRITPTTWKQDCWFVIYQKISVYHLLFLDIQGILDKNRHSHISHEIYDSRPSIFLGSCFLTCSLPPDELLRYIFYFFVQRYESIECDLFQIFR